MPFLCTLSDFTYAEQYVQVFELKIESFNTMGTGGPFSGARGWPEREADKSSHLMSM
jgi:hypothetical protein